MTADGQHAITGANDGTLRVWDVETGAELHALPGIESYAHAVVMTPDGATLVVGDSEGRVHFLRLENA